VVKSIVSYPSNHPPVKDSQCSGRKHSSVPAKERQNPSENRINKEEPRLGKNHEPRERLLIGFKTSRHPVEMKSVDRFRTPIYS